VASSLDKLLACVKQIFIDGGAGPYYSMSEISRLATSLSTAIGEKISPFPGRKAIEDVIDAIMKIEVDKP